MVRQSEPANLDSAHTAQVATPKRQTGTIVRKPLSQRRISRPNCYRRFTQGAGYDIIYSNTTEVWITDKQ